MRLLVIIIILVAYSLFKGVGRVIARSASAFPAPEIPAPSPAEPKPISRPVDKAVAAQPSVSEKSNLQTEPEDKKFIIDDPKKLILYSEIMKPKFDE